MVAATQPEINFGTGGWRAIIAEGFTKLNVQRVAQALADLIHEENVSDKPIVLGYDRRFLSDAFTWWVAEVLAANELHVHLIDTPAPTPMIMWTVRNLGCAYGVALTASHNPAIYNGMKIFTAGGRDAEVAVTDKIQTKARALGPDEIKTVDPVAATEAGLITTATTMNDYIDSIMEVIDTDAIRKAGLRIILDPMFGVSRTCLQTILLTARCDLHTIHDRRDPLFGGRMPSPAFDTVHALQRAVIDSQAALGIATDGDADRLGIVDDTGAFLHPNEILVLLYSYLLEDKGWEGPCVRNLATTHLLDRVAKAHGQECIEVPVGFKWVSAAMAEHDAIIGGESSGGLTVRGHIAGKDGIYAGSLLVEMVAKKGKPLSQIYADLIAQYGKLEMVEANLSFTIDLKEKLMQQVFTDKDLPTFKEEIDHVSFLDGCKIYFKNDGWVVIRFSGTEPLLRVFAEMPTKEAAQEIVDTVADYYHLG
ncbi:phosphonomutase [Boudabousia tangfeifanii]|uniref:Phosphonomutase n=1 Tax=Boudabousia tangfeifanii TaxID=1912795 RepID=A0A1D9MMW3_9ACTO|nr:phosphonomutase [Boudabousia tangfeifanii]